MSPGIDGCRGCNLGPTRRYRPRGGGYCLASPLMGAPVPPERGTRGRSAGHRLMAGIQHARGRYRNVRRRLARHSMGIIADAPEAPGEFGSGVSRRIRMSRLSRANECLDSDGDGRVYWPQCDGGPCQSWDYLNETNGYVFQMRDLRPRRTWKPMLRPEAQTPITPTSSASGHCTAAGCPPSGSGRLPGRADSLGEFAAVVNRERGESVTTGER